LSNRATFVEVVERVLPLASANSGVLGSRGALVGAALDAALAVARTSLAGRVNRANFGAMAEHLLGLALWDELDLKDGEKLAQAARTFLRNHSVARYPACQHQGCVMS
jgi:hypothetical protein